MITRSNAYTSTQLCQFSLSSVLRWFSFFACTKTCIWCQNKYPILDFTHCQSLNYDQVLIFRQTVKNFKFNHSKIWQTFKTLSRQLKLFDWLSRLWFQNNYRVLTRLPYKKFATESHTCHHFACLDYHSGSNKTIPNLGPKIINWSFWSYVCPWSSILSVGLPVPFPWRLRSSLTLFGSGPHLLSHVKSLYLYNKLASSKLR